MAIPEAQLETWSQHETAANDSSVKAYESLRNRLTSIGGYSINHDYDIFLQGSYRNTTNIFGESSDVDVVICYNRLLNSNLTKLPNDEKSIYYSIYNNTTEKLADFKSKVINKLRIEYPTTNIKENSKCISLELSTRKIDIVVANMYRVWNKCKGSIDQDYEQGIIFYCNDNLPIVNFPEQHRKDGEEKNQLTSVYKSRIRIFKNARKRAIDMGYLQNGVAPSYFIECLLYNVPNYNFTSNYQDSFDKIKDFIYHTLDESWMCQNEIVPIFGSDVTSWSIDKAKAFTQAMKDLWDKWQ